jgi:WD40 repeat protein
VVLSAAVLVSIQIAGFGQAAAIVESGHSGAISDMAFTPDGKILISVGGMDKDNIKLWNAENGALIKTVNYGSIANAVAISPDGKEFVVGGVAQLEVFDLASGEMAMKIGGRFRSSADDVLYTPDGKFIISAHMGTVTIWNALNGKTIREIKADENKVEALAISPDGKSLATANWDKAVHLWNIGTGQEIKKFVGHKHWVTSVVFSDDGKLLASGDQDTKIKVWDVTTGAQVQELDDEEIIGTSIKALVFAPKSQVGENTTVIGVNLSAMIFLDVAKGRWREIRGQSIISSLVLSPDRNLMVIGTQDKAITIADLRTKKQILLKSK